MFKRKMKEMMEKRKRMSVPHQLSVSDAPNEDEEESESESITITADGTTIPSITVVSHPNVPDGVEPDATGNGQWKSQGGVANPAFVPDDPGGTSDKPPEGLAEDNTSTPFEPPNTVDQQAWTLKPIYPNNNMEMTTLPPNPMIGFQASRSMSVTLSDTGSWLETDRGYNIGQRIRDLVRAFANRANRIRERIIQPPTPTPSPPPVEEGDNKDQARLSSLIPTEEDHGPDNKWLDEQVKVWCCRVKRRYIPKVLDPQSKLYISWLLLVTIFYIYNVWVIFLRAIFPYQTPHNLIYFLIVDYVSDVVYLIDILVFKVRIQYLEDGFWVDDPIKTRKNYLRMIMFKMDVLSLAPLDLLYLKYGPNTLFRLPRVLKVQTFWEFFDRVDAVARSPYIIRIIRTLTYMMFLIHLNACAYYAMSIYEGIRSNSWVFQGEGNAYIRCFYFATKTATSIGKNPKPQNESEYVFMTFSWLMGVFIFAFLIGQIRDIVATATQSKTQYRHLMDQTVRYMRNLSLPDDLQRKVRLWLNHTWEQQKTLNESKILDSLPKKMKTDVAINVHYNTLVKVQLFKDCDKALLRDLVLKLRPVLFLPGDYICKKGEVGKEMYIVNKGFVQVMGGEKGDIVLATLSEGSVFGEISLLGIPGCNRRTADVRSQGFSNLFVLSKDDLWDALKNYPDAQNVLRKKAKDIIKQNEARNKTKDKKGKRILPEMIIKQISRRPSTPVLFKTVMKIIKPVESHALLGTSSSTNLLNTPVPNETKPPGFYVGSRSPSIVPSDESQNNSPEEQKVSDNAPVNDQLQENQGNTVGEGSEEVLPTILVDSTGVIEAQSDDLMEPNETFDNVDDDAVTSEFLQNTVEESNPTVPSDNVDDNVNEQAVASEFLQNTIEESDLKTPTETYNYNNVDEHAAVASEFLHSIIDQIPESVDVQDESDKTETTAHPEPSSAQLEDKTKSGSYSEDSGISIDMKSQKLNVQKQHSLEVEKQNESYSSNESVAPDGDEEHSAHSSNENQKSPSPQIKEDWASLTSSVLSLHSLFRGSPISTTSLSEHIMDLQKAVNRDEPYLYRTPSNLSASSLAGYDNLGFVPQELLGSRRSSILSDDTP